MLDLTFPIWMGRCDSHQLGRFLAGPYHKMVLRRTRGIISRSRADPGEMDDFGIHTCSHRSDYFTIHGIIFQMSLEKVVVVHISDTYRCW